MSMGRLPAMAGMAALVAATPALAAGGHHAVDDAAILGPGQCEVETWASRAVATSRDHLAHLGAACHAAGVELGAASEYSREPGTGSATVHGAQLKWATQAVPGLSLGVTAGSSWQARTRPRERTTSAVGLLTWQASQGLALHVNWGRDWIRPAADERTRQARAGLAVDWAVRPGWVVTGERFYQQGGHFARVGVRRQVGEHWSLDLSRVGRLGGDSSGSAWTLGLTWAGS